MVYNSEILGLIFILVMLYFTYCEYKRNRLSRLEYGSWSILWIAGALLIIFNSFVNQFIEPLNIIRVLDLYIILAFMFLFFLIFYLFVSVRKAEKRIEDLTRVLALAQIKDKN